MTKTFPTLSQWLLVLIVTLPALYVASLMYQAGHAILALVLVGLLGAFAYTYLSPRAYTYRYLFPGLLGFGVFVIFPLVYTFVIGFTKYRAENLLTYDRVRADLLSQTVRIDGQPDMAFTLYRQDPAGDAFRVLLKGREKTAASYWSAPFTLDPTSESNRLVEVATALAPADLAGTPLELGELTRERLYIPLRNVRLQLPDGPTARLITLRTFGARAPIWVPGEDQSLVHQRTGQVVSPDREIGFFVDAQGEPVGFGFRTWTGIDNYRNIFTDPRIKGPFLRIFLWTFAFAGLSVVLTFAVGILLAVLLEWEDLRGRKAYRTLLILPYAVPAFLSILVFRGLFNQEAGAVNEILAFLIGTRPEWTTDPWMAKLMVLLVNIWLGYPYMMIICTGVLQSVPKAIYEASSIDGSGTWHNFSKLTFPLILPPLVPLLIASFAFNFNNFNLIFLLTGGAPKMLNSTGVAGETDILVTYTFNLAFLDSGNNYGLACAIATILFAIVGTLAWFNLRLTSRASTPNH